MALFQKSSAHDRRPFEESRVKGVDCLVAGQQRHPRFHGQRGLTGTPVVGYQCSEEFERLFSGRVVVLGSRLGGVDLRYPGVGVEGNLAGAGEETVGNAPVPVLPDQSVDTTPFSGQLLLAVDASGIDCEGGGADGSAWGDGFLE